MRNSRRDTGKGTNDIHRDRKRDQACSPSKTTRCRRVLKSLLKKAVMSSYREVVLGYAILILLSQTLSRWPVAISLACFVAALVLLLVGFRRVTGWFSGWRIAIAFPWELVLAYVLLILLSQYSSRWPVSISSTSVLVALVLFAAGFTRMCWLSLRQGGIISRIWVCFLLLLAAVIAAAFLRTIPSGVSGHVDWLLATIATAGIMAVPFFLVITGFIRLPWTFWWFAARQITGFAVTTFVLLIFLGAYGRREALFTIHANTPELVRSFGPLLAQGIESLKSGTMIGANAKTADMVEYVLGWTVFVLIAGVEVSIIANRVSEDMARLEGETRQHVPAAKQISGGQ